MATFEFQMGEAERRYQESAARLRQNQIWLKNGMPFKADTPERIRLWFRRRGLSAELAEIAITAGSVPLEIQEAFKPQGRNDPIGLERIIGTSDLLGRAFLERGLQVARTVGRISVHGRTGAPTAYGTGFLVAPRLLMTNNHVLASGNVADESVVEFDFFVTSDGAPATVKVFNLQPEVFFETDEGLDFTLVAVAESGTNGVPLASYGWNQLIPDEGKAVIGQWVNIIQHPNGEPQQLVLRNNEIVDTPDRFLMYVADTAPGSSGSPVFNDQWELVALHHAGVPDRDESGAILNLQGNPWKQWMGEHQVRWKANEGARVSRIVALVNQLQLSASKRALFESGLQKPTNSRRQETTEAQTGGLPDISRPRISADGTATWTIPLQISLGVGGLMTQQANSINTPVVTAQPTLTTQVASNQPFGPRMTTNAANENELLAAAQLEFGKRPDVINVRLGYRFVNGWITGERAIVVTVNQKQSKFELQSNGTSSLPQSFGGYCVQVTTPTLRELIARVGGIAATESALLPGALVTDEIVYRAPNVPLTVFNEKIKAKFHLSPDAGWTCLEKFLSDTKKSLVIGMYDFGATHIRDVIVSKASKLSELVLVMQSGESLGTGPGENSGTKKDDLPDAQIAQSLADAFGDRLHFGWVKLGPKNGWVANSYHIKVAVRDANALWLSSGNWQSSNQPLAPTLKGSVDFSYLKKYNREWHVIVQHPGLAKIYEAYIRNDLANGATPDFVEAFAALPNIAVPRVAVEVAPKAKLEYFAPLEVDEQMKVTPLLTPDNYFDAAIELIRSAEHEILIQNQTFNAPAGHQKKLAEFVGLLQKRQTEIPVRIVFRYFMAADARKNLEGLMDMGFDPEMIRVQPNLHTKGIIVDRKIVLLGSQNISETGISVNRDASLIIENDKIAKYFFDVFVHDWEYLTLKDIGDKFVPAFKLSEGMTVSDEAEVLTPKEYLPLL